MIPVRKLAGYCLGGTTQRDKGQMSSSGECAIADPCSLLQCNGSLPHLVSCGIANRTITPYIAS